MKIWERKACGVMGISKLVYSRGSWFKNSVLWTVFVFKHHGNKSLSHAAWMFLCVLYRETPLIRI